jgi:hypothetical protein
MQAHPGQDEQDTKGSGFGSGVQAAEEIPETEQTQGSDKNKAGTKKKQYFRDHFCRFFCLR